MAEGRGSAAFGSAVSGAATGASIGAIGGVPGALIGGGVGAVAGGVKGYLDSAPSEYEQYSQEELDKLRRRQEMGTLGLTDEELSLMGYQLGGAVNRERELTQDMLRQAAASQSLGPETFARQGAAAEAKMAGITAESQAQIQAADLAKQQMEEQKIYELLALQYDIDASNKQAALQQQGMYMMAAVDMAEMLGEQSWYGEQELEKTGIESKDLEEGTTALQRFLQGGQ
jgi:hypothetical protein